MSKYRVIRGDEYHYIQKKFLWIWRDCGLFKVNGDCYFNTFRSIEDAIDVLYKIKNKHKYSEEKKEPCVVWGIQF